MILLLRRASLLAFSLSIVSKSSLSRGIGVCIGLHQRLQSGVHGEGRIGAGSVGGRRGLAIGMLRLWLSIACRSRIRRVDPIISRPVRVWLIVEEGVGGGVIGRAAVGAGSELIKLANWRWNKSRRSTSIAITTLRLLPKPSLLWLGILRGGRGGRKFIRTRWMSTGIGSATRCNVRVIRIWRRRHGRGTRRVWRIG